MLSLIAVALAAATPSPAPSPALDASAPWWEKITKTIDGNGTERSCKYETSLSPRSSEGCEVEASGGTGARGISARAGLTSKLTLSAGSARVDGWTQDACSPATRC